MKTRAEYQKGAEILRNDKISEEKKLERLEKLGWELEDIIELAYDVGRQQEREVMATR